MKIRLPKELKGTVFTKLFSIEMNDFSIEMLLPAFFFLIESRGRGRRNKTEAEKIDEYISKFKEHNRIQGFSDADGSRVLEKWAKTSLMVIGKKGRQKRENQILYLQPLTYLTFKTGFPSASSRLRNVHYFLYQLMIDALKERGEQEAYKIVRFVLRSAFAQGITGLPEGAPGLELDGSYDGQNNNLDTDTLFSTLFMDIFPKVKIAAPLKKKFLSPTCEGQAKRLMQGIIKFIMVFKDRMPARELIYNLQTILNFEFCIYTLKLVYGTNHLVKTGELPSQYSLDKLPTEPEVYVDLTDSQKNFSSEIARECVSRDLQELSKFFTSNLRLRTIDYFIGDDPAFNDRVEGKQGGEYLAAINAISQDDDIKASAKNAIKNIINENKHDNDELDEGLSEFLDRCNSIYPVDSFSRLVMILDEAQRNSFGSKMVTWFKDVSGVEKQYGFIKGSSRHRNTWAYSISNDLLWALVHLAAIRPDEFGDLQNIKPIKIRLVEFLEFLEKRYGITINRVPAGMESFEANHSARENLSALQNRLRQMGLFDNLSDDFEAQYIKPQYKEVIQTS